MFSSLFVPKFFSELNIAFHKFPTKFLLLLYLQMFITFSKRTQLPPENSDLNTLPLFWSVIYNNSKSSFILFSLDVKLRATSQAPRWPPHTHLTPTHPFSLTMSCERAPGREQPAAQPPQFPPGHRFQSHARSIQPQLLQGTFLMCLIDLKWIYSSMYNLNACNYFWRACKPFYIVSKQVQRNYSYIELYGTAQFCNQYETRHPTYEVSQAQDAVVKLQVLTHNYSLSQHSGPAGDHTSPRSCPHWGRARAQPHHCPAAQTQAAGLLLWGQSRGLGSVWWQLQQAVVLGMCSVPFSQLCQYSCQQCHTAKGQLGQQPGSPWVVGPFLHLSIELHNSHREGESWEPLTTAAPNCLQWPV